MMHELSITKNGHTFVIRYQPRDAVFALKLVGRWAEQNYFGFDWPECAKMTRAINARYLIDKALYPMEVGK